MTARRHPGAIALFLALALMLPPVPAWAGTVLDRVTARGTLVIAVDPNYAPQSSLEEGHLIGFDVDVGKALAERMGLAPAFETPEWAAVVSGRWQGGWDVSVGSMVPTEERRAVLDFPTVYYSVPAALAVHRDNRRIRSAGDANGKRIGVPAASTYESYLKQTLRIDTPETIPFAFQIRNATVVTYTADIDALRALADGDGTHLDAALLGLPTILDAIRRGLPIRIAAQPVFIEPLAVAVEKGDEAFSAKVAGAIAALRADGTLSRLSLRWFGTDFSR